MTKKPTNTTRETKENPLGFLMQAMTSEPGDAVLMQESQGQREVVNSSVIPTDMHNKHEEFEALGFKFGEVQTDDPMWREVTLPEGWSREGSNHAMWSFIVDERGYRRCSIFYKAAFYDRSAHIGIAREPETKAQNDSYDTFADEFDSRDGDWQSYTSRREGDNLVRIARRHVLDETGRRTYDHDLSGYSSNPRFEDKTHEWVIAPDGEVLEKREIDV